jgi:hypothetical protein
MVRYRKVLFELSTPKFFSVLFPGVPFTDLFTEEARSAPRACEISIWGEFAALGAFSFHFLYYPGNVRPN